MNTPPPLPPPVPDTPPRRRWRFLLLSFALAAHLSAAAVFLWPREYGARVSPGPPPPGFSAAGEPPAAEQARPAGDTRLTAATGSLTSPDTLRPVVRSLGLAARWDLPEDAAVSRLQRSLEIETGSGGDVIALTAWSGSAAEAADIARSVRDTWLAQRRPTGTDEEQLSLPERIKRRKALVEKARLHLDDTINKYRIVDLSLPPPPRNEMIIGCTSSLGELRESIRGMEQDLARLKTRQGALANLEGDQLIAGCMRFGIRSTAFQRIYPEYRARLQALEEMQKKGVTARHRKRRALAAAVEEQRRELLPSAALFQMSMSAQISELELMISAAAQAAADEKRRADDPVEALRQHQAEQAFNQAKGNYVLQQLILAGLEDDGRVTRGIARVCTWILDKAASAAPPPVPPVPDQLSPSIRSRPGTPLLLGGGALTGVLLSLLLAAVCKGPRPVSRRLPLAHP